MRACACARVCAQHRARIPFTSPGLRCILTHMTRHAALRSPHSPRLYCQTLTDNSDNGQPLSERIDREIISARMLYRKHRELLQFPRNVESICQTIIATETSLIRFDCRQWRNHRSLTSATATGEDFKACSCGGL